MSGKGNEGDEIKKNDPFKKKKLKATKKYFLSLLMNMVFYLPKLTVFSEIGNNLMRALI